MSQNNLQDKVAFITGAAHGQGRAVALALAGQGTHIVAFDVAKSLHYPQYPMGSEDELFSLQQACEQLGVRCLSCKGDVRSDTNIQKAVEAATHTFGKVDIPPVPSNH